DGEVADAAALPRSSLDGVRFVVLPRDSVPGAAVTGFRAAPAVHAGDSIPIAVTLATWGGIAADSARIEIDVDGRRTVVRTVALPPPPATLQRSLQVPSAGLRAGDHVIDLRIAVTGDAEPGDNARVRVVSVTAAPPLVVVIDPASWEGRFLFETFQAVAGVPTRGFARIGNGRWIDLATSRAVPSEEVRAAAVASALLVVHGSGNAVGLASRRGPVWEWTVTDTGEQTLAGDWYVLDELPASRLLAALARVEWDSVPPLTSLQSSPADTGQAVLVARLGRRGQPRSVVVSAVDGGRRVLRTLGTGFYRWSLRGGASREALRALVAAGTDWLLASAGLDARAPLEVDREVTRDTPVSFRWGGAPVPDSLPVTVESDGVERRFVLRFDATGRADLALPVGVHRWSVPEPPVSGIVAVEAYSDELPPAPVTVPRVESAGRRPPGAPSHVRDRWWMYVVVLIALIGEWAWRQRRGLP
ncbi:MAG: hypothetical protein IH616_06635, partial [Gemmatimonadales bacterium]|nr:hypothetical protein [Gemmatimonadales bacterium]